LFLTAAQGRDKEGIEKPNELIETNEKESGLSKDKNMKRVQFRRFVKKREKNSGGKVADIQGGLSRRGRPLRNKEGREAVKKEKKKKGLNPRGKGEKQSGLGEAGGEDVLGSHGGVLA